jgi:pilus assembly protein Flp/PilA
VWHRKHSYLVLAQTQMPKLRKASLAKITKRFVREESGATAVEYGLMVAAIAAVIITIVFSIGFKLNNSYTFVDSEMDGITQP